MNNKIETISNLFEGKEIRSIWDAEKRMQSDYKMQSVKITIKRVIYDTLRERNKYDRVRKIMG